MSEAVRNWAGNVEYGTDRVFSAGSVEEVQEFVRKQSKLKVLGTRHCFNHIADSHDQFLSMKAMDKVVDLNAEARTVTIEDMPTHPLLEVYLLGDAKPLEWKADGDNLKVTLPDQLPGDYAYVIKLAHYLR